LAIGIVHLIMTSTVEENIYFFEDKSL